MNNFIKKIDKENIKFDITYLLFSIFSIIYIIGRMTAFSNKEKLFVICVNIFIHIIIYFLLKEVINKKIKMEKLFLLIAIPLGLTYIFAFPASSLPDDINDYSRALEISEFKLVSEFKDDKVGREFSTNIGKVYEETNYKDVINNINLKLNDEIKFYNFANKALYSFVGYIPQSLGIFIGRTLNISIYFQTILGKICNYITFVTLIYFSIKKIPYKKELIMFIALLPITLQEATSLAPDSITIASSIALTSFVVWARTTKVQFKIKHYAILYSLVLILALCKIIYLPFCFMIFLLDKENFKTNKRKILNCVCVSIVAIILNLLWLKISASFLVAYHHRSNSSEQLKYIISNPLNYLVVFFRTIDLNIFNYLREIVGYDLGAYLIKSSGLIAIVLLGILSYLIIDKEKEEKDEFNLIEKIFCFGLVAINIVLMFTSLYLQWNKVANPQITGIQGRYFIPCFLPLSMIFMNKRKDNLNNCFLAIIIFANIIALNLITIHFV